MDEDTDDGTEDGFDITKEDFNEVMTKFGRKKTESYDFLLKSTTKLCIILLEK